MQKNKNKQLNGYMTLEIALLFPVIFTMIMLMIYLGFFLYDRCLLENSAYIAALKGSRIMGENNHEVYGQTQDIAKELVEGRLFAASYVKQSVEITFDHVKVSYVAKIQPPVGTLLTRVLPRNPFYIEVSKEAKRVRTVTLLRGFRKIEALYNKREE